MTDNKISGDNIELPNDYERMVPKHHKNTLLYGEHLIRYLTARELVDEKVVLDIACGSGYGTRLLAEKASIVYGIDILPEAIEYAKRVYSKKNIHYLKGNATKIPLPSSSIDIVVSFETVEHIKNYDRFISEIKRVLKHDGLLVLSTPNVKEFPKGNYYHFHEFTYSELKTLIIKYFSYTKDYLQSNWIFTGIFYNSTSINNKKREMVDVFRNLGISSNNAIYFFILCANRPITEDIQTTGYLAEKWSEKKNIQQKKLTEQYIQNLIKINENSKYCIQKITTELKSENLKLHQTLKNNIAHSKQKITQLKQEVVKLKQQVAEKEEQLTVIYKSKSWRFINIGRKYLKIFLRR